MDILIFENIGALQENCNNQRSDVVALVVVEMVLARWRWSSHERLHTQQVDEATTPVLMSLALDLASLERLRRVRLLVVTATAMSTERAAIEWETFCATLKPAPSGSMQVVSVVAPSSHSGNFIPGALATRVC